MAELAASAADAPLKLIYFPLWAKGPAPALALAHSGLAWTGENPGDWKALKPTTPWGELPVLEIPGAGALGHELAILNYLGTRAAALRGATEAEFLVSQQLVCEAEDVYQKLVKVQPTLYARAKPPEGFLAFWSVADATVHNRDFGLQIYLEHLERFAARTPGDARFTAAGCSVGECKLFASLHALVLIRADVLAPYPLLAAFYARFEAEPPTREILATGGQMPKPFKQYFIAPPEPEPSTCSCNHPS